MQQEVLSAFWLLYVYSAPDHMVDASNYVAPILAYISH